MTALGGGLFGAVLRRARTPLRYRLRWRGRDGEVRLRDDPYRCLPTVADRQLEGFGAGTHRRLWEVLGAHPCTIDGATDLHYVSRELLSLPKDATPAQVETALKTVVERASRSPILTARARRRCWSAVASWQRACPRSGAL